MSETKKRSDIEQQYKWDVESVYTTRDAWEADFAKLPALLEPVKSLRGKLDSPSAIATVFSAEDELGQLLEKLWLYAHMKEDEDQTVGENQALMSRMRSRYSQISGELAWIDPEILKHSEETLRQWAADPALADYTRSMELLLRRKPHTLSSEEETILGLAGEVFGTPYDAFGKLTNADIEFAPAEDSDGKKHDVTNGTFYSLLMNPDRTLRENAFASVYMSYGAHKNVLNALLSGVVKSHALNAKLRKHGSSLEASLFSDNIPTSVYRSLISAVRGALPIFHEYVDLRARQLDLVGKLNMWDMYVPIVPDFKVEVDWQECRTWIEASTKPLGTEYGQGVHASFNERWYDVYENKGKRSGAYSTGAHGEKPFMLLNYHGTLSDAFTVAHELGHSMHSLMSHRYQPYRYASYPIFLAEIASTTNEALLHHYLMETKSDPRLRAYLLNHLCDSFRGTLFRQTMFAEFELEIHKRIEEGGALTAESLSEYYYGLNADYYGSTVEADRRIEREWSRIPHFYYNFYVYKYSTGFAAAQIFCQQILSGAEGREKYLGFLKSGCSHDPLDTVRTAGVDLENPDVLQKAFGGFKEAVGELSGLLTELSSATT